MTLVDALGAVMLYLGCNKQDARMTIKVVNTFMSALSLADVKSIRLESDKIEIAKLEHSAEQTKEYKINDNVFTCYLYKVLNEKEKRVAICSPAYKNNVTVRLFLDLGKFNRFKANSKISVVETFEYKGMKLLQYTAANSKVVRYAVFATPEFTFNIDDFASEVVSIGRGNSTSLFT